MTITDQLIEDLKADLRENPPEQLPKMEIHAVVDAGKRPVPCIVIHVDPDPPLMEPLDTTYEITGHIDILTSLDKHPVAASKGFASEIFDYLNLLTGRAIGKSFLHDMEAVPSDSIADERNALHRVPFEAVVQPCVPA